MNPQETAVWTAAAAAALSGLIVSRGINTLLAGQDAAMTAGAIADTLLAEYRTRITPPTPAAPTPTP
jgi:hypothetical protein